MVCWRITTLRRRRRLAGLGGGASDDTGRFERGVSTANTSMGSSEDVGRRLDTIDLGEGSMEI